MGKNITANREVPASDVSDALRGSDATYNTALQEQIVNIPG
jgi:hypothetical protein